MNIDSSISFLLSRVGLAHRNLVERHVKMAGLHSGQVSVLLELWKKDGQRQIDLAASLHLAPATVNKIIGGLLDAGLAARERVEDDARSTRIFLTESGHSIRSTLETQWRLLETETVEGFTETEQLMLRALLEKMLAKQISGGTAR